jgi:hypothetical protein
MQLTKIHTTLKDSWGLCQAILNEYKANSVSTRLLVDDLTLLYAATAGNDSELVRTLLSKGTIGSVDTVSYGNITNILQRRYPRLELVQRLPIVF